MAYSIYHISTVLASFFVHLAIYKWFAGGILRKVSPVFATLSLNKQLVLRNGVVCTVHGAVTGGLGLYLFLYPGGALPDILWYDSPVVRHTGCIMIGHMLADLLLVLFITAMQDRMMILHHFVTIWGMYSCSVIPALPYFANLMPMMELSSPFVNIRVVLYTVGFKNSTLYKLNGTVLLVVFFACRIATIPLWFQLAPLMATGELYEVGLMGLISIFAMAPVAYGLNIYWFTKIMESWISFSRAKVD